MADGVDNRLRINPGFVAGGACSAFVGYIKERDDHTRNTVIQRAVRQHAPQIPAAINAGDLGFQHLKFIHNPCPVGQQIIVAKLQRKMVQRPADICGHQVKQFAQAGGKPFDAEFFVQEKRGGVGACKQVVQIIGAVFQITHVALQLSVHRMQFFIERLHLFLRGFQFLIGGLQLFVHRGGFLVRRLQFFVCGFQILDGVLQF